MISSAFDGLTVGSALPCQTESLGQGPWYLDAARTRSPRARADVKRSLNMASNASFTDAAHPYGRPAMIAPPANVSGYVASITDVMAPPRRYSGHEHASAVDAKVHYGTLNHLTDREGFAAVTSGVTWQKPREAALGII